MFKGYNHIAGQGLERLAGLSDGVFSIAMTLIVLDIRIPANVAVHTDAELCALLVSLTPQIEMYLMSFMTLGIFWVGQQAQLHQFERSDRDLTWIHLLFLAAVAMMPFSTMLLARFITFRVALIVYWFNILVLGVALYWSWTHAERRGLVKADTPPKVSTAVRHRIVVAQLLYAVGALSCVISTNLSIILIMVIQIYYAAAPIREKGERA